MFQRTILAGHKYRPGNRGKEKRREEELLRFVTYPRVGKCNKSSSFHTLWRPITLIYHCHGIFKTFTNFKISYLKRNIRNTHIHELRSDFKEISYPWHCHKYLEQIMFNPLSTIIQIFYWHFFSFLYK